MRGLLLWLFLLSSGKLMACGCSLLDFDEAVKRAEEIFIGKIYKIEFIYFRLTDHDLDSTDNVFEPTEGDEYSIRKVTFEVERKWKGSNDKFVSVYDALNSCSFNFLTYDRYIVYAAKSKLFSIEDDEVIQGYPGITDYNTDFCSRTLPDPTRYHRSENITIESFNDIPQLDRRFRPVMLIDFRILYGTSALILMACSVFIVKYKRKPRRTII